MILKYTTEFLSKTDFSSIYLFRAKWLGLSNIPAGSLSVSRQQ